MKKRTKAASKQVVKAKPAPEKRNVPAPTNAPTNGEPWMLTAMRAGRTPEEVREYRLEFEAQRAHEGRLQFDRAWTLAQAELPAVPRMKRVDYPGKGGRVAYNYASLDEIISTIKPILGKYGISYITSTSNTDTHVTVKTILCAFGHREEPGASMTLPRDESGNKNAQQMLGSAQTYAQKYTLLAACGLATTEDVDANSAVSSEKIGADKVASIKKSLEEIGADQIEPGKQRSWTDRMLEWAKVASVEDILEVDYDNVVAQIEKRRKQIEEDNHA